FLAHMSHEIRTPLTAILGLIDVLREDPDFRASPGERIGDLATVRRNGEYLLRLIDDILDLSKIELGKVDVERVACSPWAIVADVADLMRVRLDAKGLTLTVEHQGAIPETIETDALRLRQVLINLVGNAIKFTDLGGIRVVVRLLHEGRPEPALGIEVIDTGIGMGDEVLARLFEPFYQAAPAPPPTAGGARLRLVLSQP